MYYSPEIISFKKSPLLLRNFVFLLVFLLASCIPDPIEVENMPAMEPEIVVNTQLVPNEHLVVWLTKSFGALDASEGSKPEELLREISLNDAEVTIMGRQSFDTLRALDYGVYGGLSIPFKEGETFDLRVNSKSLGMVYASTTVMKQVNFKSVALSSYYDFYDVLHAELTVSITDPSEENWYLINAHKIRSKKDDFIRNTINPESFTLLLEDKDFNGRDFTQQFEFPIEDYQAGDSIAVSLWNISPEYYSFMKMRNEKHADFLDFLSEPASFPTNVVGGKGFFNLFIPDLRIMALEEE